jgi:hypothetical protein
MVKASECLPRAQTEKYTPGFSEIWLKIAHPLILSYTETLPTLNFVNNFSRFSSSTA